MRISAALAIAVTLFSGAALAAERVPTYEKVDSTLLSRAPLAADYSLGKKNAPVVMVEYASLSCPHCADFHKKVLPELTKKYIDAGKLLYILRPFPLNEPALKGAMLIDCVGEKDKAKYYTFARVLFDAQSKWAFDANFLSSLETFASVGGVSKEQFQKCTVDPTRELKILNIRKEASDSLKVDHTPYFFINGHRYDDVPSPEKLTAYIDKQLADKGK